MKWVDYMPLLLLNGIFIAGKALLYYVGLIYRVEIL